ncbi:MAG: hypothetical protein GY694_08085 [Gammaproteobacteria bacterium]|nr:hypothetical protein [Gammaproteobacteria bacterium]
MKIFIKKKSTLTIVVLLIIVVLLTIFLLGMAFIIGLMPALNKQNESNYFSHAIQFADNILTAEKYHVIERGISKAYIDMCLNDKKN